MARNRVAQKVSIDAKGEAHFRAVPDVRRVEFRFFDGPLGEDGKPTTSTVLGLDLENVPDIGKLKDGVARQALAHGIMQKVGDEYSGSGDDTNESINSAQAMIDRIIAGEWLTEREGGSSRGDTILREAIIKVLADAGKKVDPEAEGEDGEQARANLALVDGILADKEKAKSWKARPDVKAYQEDIKIERAKARAAKAREQAASAGGQQAAQKGMDDFG